MPGAPSLEIGRIGIPIIMIVMESLLYHFRARRRGDLCRIIIVDIYCDRSRRQDF
jgi:hypothetical protein